MGVPLANNVFRTTSPPFSSPSDIFVSSNGDDWSWSPDWARGGEDGRDEGPEERDRGMVDVRDMERWDRRGNDWIGSIYLQFPS